MISSRPHTAMAQSEVLTPARETAVRMASATVGASLIVPSVMASGGRDAIPRALSVKEPPDSFRRTALTPLEPMSRPKVSGVLRKNAILNAFLPGGCSIGGAR